MTSLIKLSSPKLTYTRQIGCWNTKKWLILRLILFVSGDDKDVFADKRMLNPSFDWWNIWNPTFCGWTPDFRRWSPYFLQKKHLLHGSQEPAKDFESLAKDALEAILPAIEEIPMGNLCQNGGFLDGTSIVEIIFNGASIHFLKWNFIMVDFLETIFPLFKIQGFVGKRLIFVGQSSFLFFNGTMVDWFYGKTLDKIF